MQSIYKAKNIFDKLSPLNICINIYKNSATVRHYTLPIAAQSCSADAPLLVRQLAS